MTSDSDEHRIINNSKALPARAFFFCFSTYHSVSEFHIFDSRSNAHFAVELRFSRTLDSYRITFVTVRFSFYFRLILRLNSNKCSTFLAAYLVD